MVIIYNSSTHSNLSFNFPDQNLAESKNGFTCGDKFSIEPNNG